MSTARKIRVLVVDDSAVVRRAISDALNQDPELEVVGTACDPYVARDKILELNPDVLTLDIEMPRMDGLTFLKILQERRPLPVVVISSLTQAGSDAAIAALEGGAVDVLAKPGSSWSIGHLREQLASRVKAAAQARLKNLRPAALPPARRSEPVTIPPVNRRKLILIGASTGGTEAIKSVLTCLPQGLPGICIVQHIPPVFSKAFAERMNRQCEIEVREAADGDPVLPGQALIAPGDFHMTVVWAEGRYRVRLNQQPFIHHVRPAVDVLFKSAATCAGRHAVAALLTGMGCDGAEGLLSLKRAGATTVAQDEQSCVVYGMPRAAVELGAVDHILPLDRIAPTLLKELQEPEPGPTTPTTLSSSR